MTSSGPCTRKSALALPNCQLPSHAHSSSPIESPQGSPQHADAITRLVEKTPVQAVSRQSSLIPAYKYEDSIDCLELKNLIGTPFPCELEQSKKREKKKRNKANRLAKKNEEINAENSTPNSTESPLPYPKLKNGPAEDINNDDNDSTIDLVAFMKAMTLSKSSDSSSTDTATTTSGASAGPLGLRGLPAPTGSHIRFLDSDSNNSTLIKPSPRRRVYLRGIPQPTGTHKTFEEED